MISSVSAFLASFASTLRFCWDLVFEHLALLHQVMAMRRSRRRAQFTGADRCAGTILPTAPDMMFSSEKPWDFITLDVWPAGESSGSLYQDDEKTTAFTKGESTTTAFHFVEQPGKSVALNIEPSNQKFGPRQWIARFHLTSVITAVTLDGKPVPATADESVSTGWAFDAANGTLAIRLPGEHAARALVITLDGSSHPRPPAPKVDAPALGGTI